MPTGESDIVLGIQAVWTSSEIILLNACITPAGYCIGGHQFFVIDFWAQDIIGQISQCMVC
jgi:hypothetical protein